MEIDSLGVCATVSAVHGTARFVLIFIDYIYQITIPLDLIKSQFAGLQIISAVSRV